MAKIIAYSDAHIGSPDTLAELEFNPDFNKLGALCEVIREEQPDLVISVGDYWEPVYDSQLAVETNLTRLTDIFLAGNHDFSQEHEMWQQDGITFIHKANSHIRGFTVCGHTHSPMEKAGFIDLGSLTMTGTFAVCVDGKCELRRL